ncbi:MAG: class I fructose-bisphosphate aldolase [Candidatus Velthaea sp.]|jgi:fructose-bisphosphate aldolase class I
MIDFLKETARAMVAEGKGILAIDESNGTCNARFEKLGIPPTEQMRRSYRELLLTAPGLLQYISGAILYDETIRQSDAKGQPFVEVMNAYGILPGIKVDTGTVTLSGTDGEKITEGIDGLRRRIDEYVRMGARFAKWRAVFTIGRALPSAKAIAANAHALARYAAICQAGGLVPIVEPELLMDGSHSIEQSANATIGVLSRVFTELAEQDVALEAVVLKPSMVIAGASAPAASSIAEVARHTLRVLTETVPPAVAGIAFLSGGQSNESASAHLDAMNRDVTFRKPWPVTFSYGRALQQPALERWRGNAAEIPAAQALLVHRARMNSLASRGGYTAECEAAAAVSA